MICNSVSRIHILHSLMGRLDVYFPDLVLFQFPNIASTLIQIRPDVSSSSSLQAAVDSNRGLWVLVSPSLDDVGWATYKRSS